MSDSVRPHKRQPTRLCRPWDSPGKNTGVGCHFLLQCMKVKSEIEVAQSCPTLSDPMDCSLPGSSIHGIFQARVLEWGAIAFLGTDLYALLYLKQIISKRLLRELCSIFFNNLNGKRTWKRIDICICITESLCCTSQHKIWYNHCFVIIVSFMLCF